MLQAEHPDRFPETAIACSSPFFTNMRAAAVSALIVEILEPSEKEERKD